MTQTPNTGGNVATRSVLVALAESAQRGERCLWVTEIAGLSGLSLREALAVVEQLYRAGLAQPYFSDHEARRAAVCITNAGLAEAARLLPLPEDSTKRRQHAAGGS